MTSISKRRQLREKLKKEKRQKLDRLLIEGYQATKEEDKALMKIGKKANQIRTVDKRRLIKLLAKVSFEELNEVEEAILIHLGIE